MPKIGEFNETDYGYRGEIRTSEKVSSYDLYRNDEKETDNQPDYIITSPNGAEVGAAWERENRETGTVYLSYDIDDPTRSQRLQGNLSPNDRTGNLDAYFSRNQGENRRAARGSSEPQGGMDGPPQDDIQDFTVQSNGQDQGRSL